FCDNAGPGRRRVGLGSTVETSARFWSEPELAVCQRGSMNEPESPHPQDCRCGVCGATMAGPLRDYAHRWPDRVFALSSAERASRTWCSSDENPDFVALDGASFFVRGLLPVPLEENDEFRYGVWLEVSQEDFEHILQAWNDEAAYATLHFQA